VANETLKVCIQAESVSRVFSSEYALHRVDLSVESGNLYLLLGPNGAGKSTLLRILATLDRPTSGTIQYLHGETQSRLHGVRGHIGWVSHDSLLYLEMTGRENLTFFSALYGLKNAKESIAEQLSMVGLSQSADRLVRTYSRGMRQRLTIARALLHKPSVLLLDEPYTGLDDCGREQVSSILRGVRDRGGLVVLSTHLMDFEAPFVDDLMVLQGGKLRYAGPLEGDLVKQYQEVLSSFQGQSGGRL
jgi:heme exporter protein A